MQRAVFVVILVVILIALPLLVLSDTASSTADPDISRNEVTGSMSETGNSLASGTITITMYTGDGE